jgi:hypothetical protein
MTSQANSIAELVSVSPWAEAGAAVSAMHDSAHEGGLSDAGALFAGGSGEAARGGRGAGVFVALFVGGVVEETARGRSRIARSRRRG